MIRTFRKSRTLFLAVLIVPTGCVTGGGGLPLGGGTSQADVLAPLLGGVIGTIPGLELSRRETRAAVEAEFQALQARPGAAPIAWGEANGPVRGEASAGQPYRVGTQDCRPLVHVVETATGLQRATGAACREPDGRWVRVG